MPETSRIPNIEHPLVSLIIVNYNGAHFLEPCLRSLATLDYPPARYEVLVVDNGSTDGSAELTQQQFPAVRWVTHTVNNYCRALNVGVSLARGELFAFLNNDTTVDPRWLIELVTVMQQDPRVAMCGSKVRLMSGALNSTSHTSLPNFYWIDRGCGELDAGQYDRAEDVGSVTGCAVLVRRRALEDVGGWDEDFVMYMEDVDLAHRLTQRGWAIRYVPSSLVHHVLHGTKPERSSEEWTERNRLLFLAKHEPAKLGDALFGHGFFAYPRQSQPGVLLRVMPVVLEKLVKHHGEAVALSMIHDLFEQLHKIQNAEWDTLTREKIALKEALSDHRTQLQALTAKVDSAHQQLMILTQESRETIDEIVRVKEARQRLAAELSRIYGSHTYRWLARPLWTLLSRMKGIVSRRASKGGLSREKEVLASQRAVIPEGMDEAGRLVGCTIISKNYLAYARVLCRSFLEHHPRGKFVVLLVDKMDGSFDPAAEPFELIELPALVIPELRRLCFQYSIVELNTAVKPYFLTYLFDQRSAQKVVYLDPDILILKPLAEVEAVLDRSWAVLTPHITSPMTDDGHKPSELTILQAGTFNLGFIGLRKCETTQAFLRWWQERLFSRCEMAPERGMHVDQKWVDLVPSFFDGVHVLRNPGYNVAYWNLAQRPITICDEEVLVAGQPCVFFHFSGLQPEFLAGVSKHQNRLTLDRIGDAAVLFKRYRDLLMAAGYGDTTSWPYAFGSFDNGVPIPEAARKLYLQLGDAVRAFGDPFSTGNAQNFFHWLNQPADMDGARHPTLTRLWKRIYSERQDLQRAYPDAVGTQREAFLTWVLDVGRFEHRVDDQLVPQLDRSRTRMRGLKGWTVHLIARCLLPFEPVLTPLARRLVGRDSNAWHQLKAVRYKLSLRGTVNKKQTLRSPLREHPRGVDGVNVSGYLDSEKGVGEGVRSSIRALEAAGIPYILNNTVDTSSLNHEVIPGARTDANDYPINLIHVNADQVPVFAQAKGSSYFQNRYSIGYWAWELNRFPEQWLPSFSYLNEVWVPSRYVSEILAPLSLIPITVIPRSLVIVDEEAEGLGEAPVHHPRRFRFLFMFDFMSYWQRKNPFELIHAFQQAFEGHDECELIIKTSHAEFAPQAFHELQDASQGKRVTVMDGIWDRSEVMTLLKSCDCYVSLHRSEGFGLTMAEAMALRKPVIATGYSGNLEFMTSHNSLLVDYHLITLDEDCGPYQREGQWAAPHLEHAVALMRWVVAHPAEARAMGAHARNTIQASFSPTAIGAFMKARLACILGSQASALQRNVSVGDSAVVPSPVGMEIPLG